MKINLKLAKKIFFCVFLFSFLLIPLTVSKASQIRANNIYLPDDLSINDVFVAAGNNININASINDDLYLAGANIVVSGPVEGDIIAVASNLVINSEVKGNVRAIGGTLIINGKIGKNVTVAAGNLTINKEAEIGRNLFLAGGIVEIDGKINGNLHGAAGTLILNSQILGNAYLTIDPSGDLILYPEANIYGNLEYSASQPAEFLSGAKVQKEEKFSQWQKQPKASLKTKLNGFIFAFWLAAFLGALLVGLIFITLFKDFILKAQKNVDKNILFSVLRGLAYLIVTPVILIILIATVIGLPLALILGALYFIVLYLGTILIGIYLGDRIIKLFNKKKEPVMLWSMILGVAIIYLLYAIPFIGWLIKLIIILWGLGVLVEALKKDLKLEKI